MKFYLIVAKGKHAGMPIPIDVDLFMIGSGKMCQLRTKTDGVAEQQCALMVREKKIFIRDMGSDSSTVVNGAAMPPSEEWPVHAGDHLSVGPLEFLIQFNEHTLNKRDLEEWALKCLDSDAEKSNLVESLDEFTRITQSKYQTASNAAQSILDQMQAKRGLVQGRLRISREGPVTVIRINDSYLVEEAELALIKKELHEQLGLPNLRVLIDFKNVRRMSSMAAMMICELARWLQSWGSTMAICRLKSELKASLQTLPAFKDIPVFGDKDTALANRW